MMAEHDESDRREQVLAAAERLILAQSTLTISMHDIAEELGVSRSLLYVYFDSVPQMVEELFLREARRVETLLEGAWAEERDFTMRILDLFHAYLDTLVRRGHLSLLVLRERHRDSPLGPEATHLFRRVLRKLSRDVVHELRVSPREAFVILELLAAIPESLGRMVSAGQLSRETADATSRRLIQAALGAMAPAGT